MVSSGGEPYTEQNVGPITDQRNQRGQTISQDFDPILQGKPVLGSFKKGGVVPKTGLYELHKNEEVVPFNEASTTHSIAGKIPSSRAGYMELRGAEKDAGCSKVEVAGGVSSDRGCCNKFEPEADDTEIFSCGTCQYVKLRGTS